MVKLDEFDRRLLVMLDRYGRASLSEIARKLKLGRDLVGYRVSRLEDERVIQGYAAVINPYRLGFSIFKTYLRLKNDRARRDSLVKRLHEASRVFCCAECDGQWDAVFNTLSYNAHEFHQMLESLLDAYSDIIIEFSVCNLTRKVFFPRKYLSTVLDEQFEISGAPTAAQVDEIDRQILAELAQDGRSPLAVLAEKLGILPPMVKKRIERLESESVISAYRAEIDRRAFGRTLYKLQVMRRQYSESSKKKLIAFCAKHADIVYLFEQLGPVGIELGVEARDYEHFNAVASELRAAFPELIESLQTLLIRNDAYRWLPANALQNRKALILAHLPAAA